MEFWKAGQRTRQDVPERDPEIPGQWGTRERGQTLVWRANLSKTFLLNHSFQDKWDFLQRCTHSGAKSLSFRCPHLRELLSGPKRDASNCSHGVADTVHAPRPILATASDFSQSWFPWKLNCQWPIPWKLRLNPVTASHHKQALSCWILLLQQSWEVWVKCVLITWRYLIQRDTGTTRGMFQPFFF